MAQDPNNIQFINSIDDHNYEKVMLCNDIANTSLQKGISTLCGNSKVLLHTKNHSLYISLVTNEFGAMLRLNGG